MENLHAKVRKILSLVIGLDHSWLREQLFSKSRSLATIFFLVHGFGLEGYVFDSTSANYRTYLVFHNSLFHAYGTSKQNTNRFAIYQRSLEVLFRWSYKSEKNC